MAAKKPTRPRKFKQARKDALAQAKKDFSGKKQAGLKDRELRISADDKKVLSEVKAEAKGNYITDDRGNKINVKPTETSAERIARDRREARAELQRKFDIEDGKMTKDGRPIKQSSTAPTELGERRLDQMKKAGISEKDAPQRPAGQYPEKKAKKKKFTTRPAGSTPVKTADDVKKVATAEKKAMKPATKGFSAGKTLTPKGQAVYDDLIKQGVKPKSAMNKAIFRQEKTTATKPTVAKATAPKVVTKNDALKFSAQGKMGTPQAQKLKELEKKVGDAKSTAKKVTTAKTTKNVSTIGKVLNSPVGKVAKTAVMIAGPGKFLKAGALIKGAIGANKAVKVTKAVKAAESGKKISAANNARKAANAAKAEKARKAGTMGKVKKVGLAAAGFYALSKIPTGDGAKDAATKTLPQRPAGQYPKGGGKGLKLGPNINAGGSTTKVYRVEQGDTLSSIAKKAGVSLSELKKANPKASSQKYIFRNTPVKIPQGKAIPSGSYKGPVPYLPGSSAAKKYELSRKK